MTSCERQELSVVDPKGFPPLMLSAQLSTSGVNTDTINVGPIRQPTDVLAIPIVVTARVAPNSASDPVLGVGCSVLEPTMSASIASGNLHDDGIPPDRVAGDSIYTGQIQFQILRSSIGVFSVVVFAQDVAGYRSSSVLMPLTIVRSNRPPVLSNLQADSSVSIGTGHLLQLRVTAIDPDGQADILKVYFNSYRPDGSPASGNPFQMLDDGNVNGLSGDTQAGDGIYSLKVNLPVGTMTGTYRFEFMAVDRSLDTSNVIVHRMVVNP